MICRSAGRAYFATRILSKQGLKARIISGMLLSARCSWQLKLNIYVNQRPHNCSKLLQNLNIETKEA